MREEVVACKTEIHIILLLLNYHVIIDYASQSLFYYLIALKYCTVKFNYFVKLHTT